jgi:hypothetical protein
MSRRRRRSGNQSNQSTSSSAPNAAEHGSSAAKAASEAAVFWGEVPAEADEPGTTVERIRPTPDPAALPRSLGDPPLTPDTAAAHHVAVVYEEAVRAATALAAANGLLDDPDAAG